MTDNYEKIVKENEERNQSLLILFEGWLEEKGLSQKTVKKHVKNISFFIHEYLLYYDALAAEEGIDQIRDFMTDWFPRKAMWASKTVLKAYGTGFKKFYTCLYEKGFVAKGELDDMKRIIKEEMSSWIAMLEARDGGVLSDLLSELSERDSVLSDMMQNDEITEDDYLLEEYLDDIDLDALMRIISRHPRIPSFDYLHGLTCAFATMPFPLNKRSFAEMVLEEMLGALEEKEFFFTVLSDFAFFTQAFAFSKGFIPYCNGWDYENNVDNANAAQWCQGFLDILTSFDGALGISQEQLEEVFMDEMNMLVALAAYGNDRLRALLEKLLIDKGLSFEDYALFAYDELITLPGYVYKKATEINERKKHTPATSQKVGRNDPCPCGSGKKYKKCCGK